LFLFQEVVLFLVSVPLDDHRETGKLLPMKTRNDPIQELLSMTIMISPGGGAAINMDMPLNQNVNKSD
jgi:hypothetical protein